jgi:RNA polymerase-binding transcription factor DksA
MTADRIDHFRRRLEELGRQLTGTSRTLETETLRASSGEAAGGLSNVPMHLGDVGSEAFSQELNSTLLENEEYIGREVDFALTRIEKGVFGKCEECGKDIPIERLEILPYARYCVPCTEKLQSGGDANLNTGRPAGWGSSFEHPNSLANQRRAGEKSPSIARRVDSSSPLDDDLHAAGTPGGGSGIGGLAGTNEGSGEPDDEPLEDAMGSGNFDRHDEADEAEQNDAYSGPSGGAIGGSPANKRSTGGRRRNSAPRPSDR